MSELELPLREVLYEEVPLRLDRTPSWNDVLMRAGVSRRDELTSRRQRSRVVLALAFVVAAVVVTGTALAALGVRPFGSLSSWLRGAPGVPAPRVEQKGFTTRNSASYAAFPLNTRLRLLDEVSVDGRTFSLLGFRTGSSLCLRVVRADQPAANGANQCVTVQELRGSPSPVLVASQTVFPVVRSGRALAVYGIFGFADDTIGAVVARWRSGARRMVRVENNAFLVLRAAPLGPPAPWWADPILRVGATTRRGRRISVPFVSDGAPAQRVPSYYRTVVPSPAALPGPSKATARLAGSDIGWLARHDPRGRSFTLPQAFGDSLGEVVFSRSIQPDPDTPFRVGLTLASGPRRPISGGLFHGPTFMSLRPHHLTLCVSELEPLVERGYEGGDCAQRGAVGRFFPEGTPVSVAIGAPDTGHMAYAAQLVRLYGIAADGVRAIDVFLASGLVVSASLRDNVWTAQVPAAQLPAKLVAYDAKHRPVWVSVPQTLAPPKLTPCPAATQPEPMRPAKPYERLDLGALTVHGLHIIGATPAQVEDALGHPDLKRPRALTAADRGQIFIYDGTGPTDARLWVEFARRPDRSHDRLRVVWLSYRAPDLVDAKIGHALRLQPAELQHRIESAYASTYRLATVYGTDASSGCNATFEARKGGIQVIFGINPWASTRPFLTIRTDALVGGPPTP